MNVVDVVKRHQKQGEKTYLKPFAPAIIVLPVSLFLCDDDDCYHFFYLSLMCVTACVYCEKGEEENAIVI